MSVPALLAKPLVYSIAGFVFWGWRPGFIWLETDVPCFDPVLGAFIGLVREDGGTGGTSVLLVSRINGKPVVLFPITMILLFSDLDSLSVASIPRHRK